MILKNSPETDRRDYFLELYSKEDQIVHIALNLGLKIKWISKAKYDRNLFCFFPGLTQRSNKNELLSYLLIHISTKDTWLSQIYYADRDLQMRCIECTVSLIKDKKY